MQPYQQPGQPQHYQQPNQPQAMVQQPSCGIEVLAKHGFLQWMLMLVSPMMLVNGHPYKLIWGRHIVPMPPGQYQVNVYFPWFFQKANMTHATVTVYDGHVTALEYSTAFLTFMSGTLRDHGCRPSFSA
ncbi:MAG TPA: hypothetical protein PKA88_22125 [Polyangiaceae bacterium]|nr:hypothetical protein [Polyangiaceae bacterium]HMR77526.1 hypothetical protein [Polyangiaceae bacterium]